MLMSEFHHYRTRQLYNLKAVTYAIQCFIFEDEAKISSPLKFER